MKAVISTSYDDQYFFYLPITTWLWNKLGVGIICFMPTPKGRFENKMTLVRKTINSFDGHCMLSYFNCREDKEATYAQCSRLYAAGLILPEDEILIVSDIDMGVFKIPELFKDGIAVTGTDLVPEKQLPMCYITGSVFYWKKYMSIANRNPQQCLDDMLGNIDCENMRGNYWGKDQETAYNHIAIGDVKWLSIPRARPGTQFASNRIDRDDAFFMDRLSPDIIDYHMHRPGYTDENFEKILAVIQYFYPNDDLTWMREYQQQYKSLL